MFSSGAALGSESSRPVGEAFCILGFSVTVRVRDHRALTATAHECCFVTRGGHPHRPRRRWSYKRLGQTRLLAHICRRNVLSVLSNRAKCSLSLDPVTVWPAYIVVHGTLCTIYRTTNCSHRILQFSLVNWHEYIHTHPPTESCKAEKVWLVLQTALADFITLLNRGLSKYWVWPQIWKTQIRPATITVFIFSFFSSHIKEVFFWCWSKKQ